MFSFVFPWKQLHAYYYILLFRALCAKYDFSHAEYKGHFTSPTWMHPVAKNNSTVYVIFQNIFSHFRFPIYCYFMHTNSILNLLHYIQVNSIKLMPLSLMFLFLYAKWHRQHDPICNTYGWISLENKVYSLIFEVVLSSALVNSIT